jgi:hypothetical protein
MGLLERRRGLELNEHDRPFLGTVDQRRGFAPHLKHKERCVYALRWRGPLARYRCCIESHFHTTPNSAYPCCVSVSLVDGASVRRGT